MFGFFACRRYASGGEAEAKAQVVLFLTCEGRRCGEMLQPHAKSIYIITPNIKLVQHPYCWRTTRRLDNGIQKEIPFRVDDARL